MIVRHNHSGTLYSLYERNISDVRNSMNVHVASDDTVTYVLVASDVWNRRCSDITVQKQWDMDGVYHQLHLHKYNFCDLTTDLK